MTVLPQPVLETVRLRLRPWEERDLAPFAALNADPVVMRHFPGTLDRAGSDALVARIEARRREVGFCFAAAERRADGALLGLVGLGRMRMPEVPRLDGAVEVAWRLGRAHWGRGYATEAARAWLGWGFAALGLKEIVAITVPANLASQAVMRRLGMEEVPEGRFEHPAVPAGNPLRSHVFFRIGRDRWLHHGPETTYDPA
jgi:RimJ/RimL family protein N-acetyltransferase